MQSGIGLTFIAILPNLQKYFKGTSEQSNIMQVLSWKLFWVILLGKYWCVFTVCFCLKNLDKIYHYRPKKYIYHKSCIFKVKDKGFVHAHGWPCIQ